MLIFQLEKNILLKIFIKNTLYKLGVLLTQKAGRKWPHLSSTAGAFV